MFTFDFAPRTRSLPGDFPFRRRRHPQYKARCGDHIGETDLHLARIHTGWNRHIDQSTKSACDALIRGDDFLSPSDAGVAFPCITSAHIICVSSNEDLDPATEQCIGQIHSEHNAGDRIKSRRLHHLRPSPRIQASMIHRRIIRQIHADHLGQPNRILGNRPRKDRCARACRDLGRRPLLRKFHLEFSQNPTNRLLFFAQRIVWTDDKSIPTACPECICFLKKFKAPWQPTDC